MRAQMGIWNLPAYQPPSLKKKNHLRKHVSRFLYARGRTPLLGVSAFPAATVGRKELAGSVACWPTGPTARFRGPDCFRLGGRRRTAVAVASRGVGFGYASVSVGPMGLSTRAGIFSGQPIGDRGSTQKLFFNANVIWKQPEFTRRGTEKARFDGRSDDRQPVGTVNRFVHWLSSGRQNRCLNRRDGSRRVGNPAISKGIGGGKR